MVSLKTVQPEKLGSSAYGPIRYLNINDAIKGKKTGKKKKERKKLYELWECLLGTWVIKRSESYPERACSPPPIVAEAWIPNADAFHG